MMWPVFVRPSLVVPQAFPGLSDADLTMTIARAAEDHGFRVLEIVAPESDALLDAAGKAARSRDAALILLAGLPLLRARASLSADGPERRKAVETVARILDRASAVGAEAVLVTTGPDPAPSARAAAVERLVESLVELSDRASGSGVTVRLEPTDTNLHHRQVVGPTALAVDLVRRVARRGGRIDINLDLSHIIELGESPGEAFAAAAGDCRHVHLANCAVEPGHPLRGDRHPPFGWPGTEVDQRTLARALTSLDRSGYFADAACVLGVEVIPPEDRDPWATLGEAVAAVGAAMERAGLTPRAGDPRSPTSAGL